MTYVLIERELLERILNWREGDAGDSGRDELRAILAAPRQPGGEGLEVVAYRTEWTARDGGSKRVSFGSTVPCRELVIQDYPEAVLGEPEPLCRLSDHQRVIAELRGECERLRKALVSKADSNAQLVGVCIERDTLRQQLDERDAQIASMRAEVTPFIETHWMPVARQRDKLAGLLADVKADYTHAIHWEDLHSTMKRIDAALAEVNK